MPKVSVIIATYNRASLLQRAIESVLSQTFQHFEIIIVDDGSTDTTAQVVETYRHPKIRYIRHSENRGKSVALNNGLESAKGEYIAFLDDDDLWLRHKLQLQVDILEKSDDDVGIVFSGRMSMDEDGGILEVIRPKRLKYHPRDFLLRNISILASTVLAKKKYLSMVGGFDEAITNREDLDLWIRLSEHCRFKPISEPLVKCLHAEESLTRHAETARECMLMILNKCYLRLGFKLLILDKEN